MYLYKSILTEKMHIINHLRKGKDMKKTFLPLLSALLVFSLVPVSVSAADAWVTDGLAALYDGANNTAAGQNKETSTWEDTSGNGINFEIDLDDTNYWTDNAFHANTAWCYFDDAIVDVVNGDKFTVEIVFGEFTGYGASFNTFLNSDNDNFAWFIRNDGDFLEFKNSGNSRPKVAGGVDFVNNSTLTVTFDLDECECNMYVDGELIGQEFPAANVGADSMFLAHADASRNWEGDIHCIRFYNTALTAEQVAANAAVDQAKYFTETAPAAEESVEEAPAEEPAAEETPVVEEAPAADETVVEEAPVEETAAEETVEAPVTVEEAPQTFDIGVIAAVSALISLAGYTITKKSK